MTGELNAPIDDLHRECIIMRDDIRRRVKLARYHASLWRPAPCPPDWRPT